MQPPESQARRQSLPLPARKRSMLILMAVTLLNRSPLRYLAYLTHHLASSCVGNAEIAGLDIAGLDNDGRARTVGHCRTGH